MLKSLPSFRLDSWLQKRKEKEARKQVAYVKYNLNEFKELSQFLGDFRFVENCILQKIVLFIFLSVNLIIWPPKLFFHLVFALNSSS